MDQNVQNIPSANKEKPEDFAGKKYENLSAKNHENLPQNLQEIQNEKKQHTWEQNENKHIIKGQDFNVEDTDRKISKPNQIQGQAVKEGDLNWNQSQNEPWNVLQNNTQSIKEDKTSILQNQSRDVPLNAEKGVALHHKNPQDNKKPTQEETQLKHEYRAPPEAPSQPVECCEKGSHGPTPGSQKQNLTGKDMHREEERKNMEGVQYSLHGQKELVTKASKKGMNADDKLQGPSWVAQSGDNTSNVESKTKDFKATMSTDQYTKTGLEKNEGDVVKENRANQDSAHGK